MATLLHVSVMLWMLQYIHVVRTPTVDLFGYKFYHSIPIFDPPNIIYDVACTHTLLTSLCNLVQVRRNLNLTHRFLTNSPL